MASVVAARQATEVFWMCSEVCESDAVILVIGLLISHLYVIMRKHQQGESQFDVVVLDKLHHFPGSAIRSARGARGGVNPD